ncbi:hypothetical protein TVAG_101680 [Trichomonas vaginalis G3]|uniref:Uncharacterized protein n=1 Tax=Trichomonas vaginalis (strain ATCC PRA-98 / G3) TaxID=412133 RepID=A2DJQ0_TRIV3|nr:hypothetical protein TVAGG3_1035160 [Trichomonas vaginalis G3]EAY19450.1 hypothetical protein TVAG_101680 [Trichomonas vaginalis G3]KAI5493143.1 hypothetical protein TVAGG3_1035160 [Trichomonas vaginalis G3]|eukprot:XP_001580436.1 hypothetical protein [Trichomonas vaginalis G3]
MADREDSELEGLLLARKLSSLIPVSISIDELKFNDSKKKITENSLKKISPEKEYIPPSPVVHSVGNNQPQETPKPNKFTFLLKSKKTPIKSPSFTRMKYELPNMQKIGTSGTNLRPIMTVSFSSLDLSNAAKSDKDVKQDAKSVVPEARQIESDCDSESSSL